MLINSGGFSEKEVVFRGNIKSVIGFGFRSLYSDCMLAHAILIFCNICTEWGQILLMRCPYLMFT